MHSQTTTTPIDPDYQGMDGVIGELTYEGADLVLDLIDEYVEAKEAEAK